VLYIKDLRKGMGGAQCQAGESMTATRNLGFMARLAGWNFWHDNNTKNVIAAATGERGGGGGGGGWESRAAIATPVAPQKNGPPPESPTANR
jgi:hypothetical protein